MYHTYSVISGKRAPEGELRPELYAEDNVFKDGAIATKREAADGNDANAAVVFALPVPFRRWEYLEAKEAERALAELLGGTKR